jgi:hypothetical protein
MRRPFASSTGPFPQLCLLIVMALVCAACSGTPGENARATNQELSVGVFGECELPTPLQPLLDSLGAALGTKGIEISGEAILAYDHDLQCGGNTLELLVGGETAWSLGAAIGLGQSDIQGLLDNFGASAGLLVTATVGLDFGGSWEGIHFAIDGFDGGDVFGAGGGRWKILWSTDKSEVGEEGFWASITVATDGACSAGGVLFTSDSDDNVLKNVWDDLTGHDHSSDAGAPCGDGGASRDGGASSPGDGGAAPGDGDGGSYAFVQRRSSITRHSVSPASGASATIPFTWHDAPGLQPSADLSVEVAGKPVIQVYSAGHSPFARGGLEVVRLVAGALYDVVLARTSDTMSVSLVDAGGEVVLHTETSASEADVVLPAAFWRQSVTASL